MLIPQLQHNVYYYATFPLIWSLFIALYYGVSAAIASCCPNTTITKNDTPIILHSGVLAYFFATPFIQAYTNCFFFLFFLSTQTLLLYGIASFIFQFIYLQNTNLTSSKSSLATTLCITNMFGYWIICLLYYILPYSSKLLGNMIQYNHM